MGTGRDPAKHLRLPEPRKMNVDPSCPGYGIARDSGSLENWDIAHKDRGKFGFSHIPRDRWDEIFGKR